MSSPRKPITLGLICVLILFGLLLYFKLTSASTNPQQVAKIKHLSTNTLSEALGTAAPPNNSGDSTGHNVTLIRQYLHRDPRALQVIHRPDGSRTVHLQGQFKHGAAAQRMPDGSLRIGCFERAQPMLDFLHQQQDSAATPPTSNSTEAER